MISFHLEYEELLDQEASTEEKAEPVPELKDVDDFDLNKYISAKVQIPKDGHTFAVGKVVKQVRDDNGELIGKSNSNHCLIRPCMKFSLMMDQWRNTMPTLLLSIYMNRWMTMVIQGWL